MPVLDLGTPNEKQLAFLDAEEKHVGFGGARGGGKSWVVRVKAALLCFAFAGIKCMIIRKTYPELQENHIIPLCQMLHCHDPDKKKRFASYNDSKKHIVFPNGSRILFRYCDNEKDAERFQGTEVDVLFIDEATHQSEEKMKKLTACVRGVNGFPKRIYYTCNPGGEGHGWVKRLFIDKKYRDNERPEDYVFIQSLVTDNFALMEADPDYIRQLEALPPKLRDAWLLGRWDIFRGQFFEEFRTDPDPQMLETHALSVEAARAYGRWCHVIKPFPMDEGQYRTWPIYRSYDFGSAKPWAVGYYTVDPDGVIYRIMEVYGSTGIPNEGNRWTPDQQFQYLAELERTHPWLKGRQIQGVADPSIWDGSRGISIAETAMEHGIYFTPGDNDRIPGLMQCRYRLQFDEAGRARFYCFDTCKEFIRTIPLQIYDDVKVEDINTDGEDHICDEWRYFCMSRPIAAMKPVQERVILSDPLNQFEKRS